MRLKEEKELPRRIRFWSDESDVSVGRCSVPERAAPLRSMALTPPEEEQVIPRHAHGDGACGSQSERKL